MALLSYHSWVAIQHADAYYKKNFARLKFGHQLPKVTNINCKEQHKVHNGKKENEKSHIYEMTYIQYTTTIPPFMYEMGKPPCKTHNVQNTQIFVLRGCSLSCLAMIPNLTLF